jgi:Zn-dependent metalloprotease
MARRGDPTTRARARAAAQQARLSRVRRAARDVQMPVFLAGTGAPPAGGAERLVYDCRNRWSQRVDLVRDEDGAPADDHDVDLVHAHAALVRDYFETELQRNSIDNLGMKLVLNVHFGEDYMNAFWDGDEMTFGDGDGEIFTSFARSLDVTAHELAHGVTQFTADLEYQGQSGALNEHFSDVFGAAITQRHLGQDAGAADWLVGNEIMGPALYGEALRSMKAPGAAYDNRLMGADPQPDHMSRYFTGPEDNQGVHINSGIMNRVFYLVAIDIGTPCAAKVWYHALRHLWPNAQFDDAVEVCVEAARIMTKRGVVPLGTTQTVRLAFKEVGLPR